MATLTLRVAHRIERIPPLIRIKMMAFVFPWCVAAGTWASASGRRRRRRYPTDAVGSARRYGDVPFDFAPLRRGFSCVPSMIDSLEVEVLYPA
jgi:hypothetical protein